MINASYSERRQLVSIQKRYRAPRSGFGDERYNVSPTKTTLGSKVHVAHSKSEHLLLDCDAALSAMKGKKSALGKRTASARSLYRSRRCSQACAARLLFPLYLPYLNTSLLTTISTITSKQNRREFSLASLLSPNFSNFICIYISIFLLLHNISLSTVLLFYTSPAPDIKSSLTA